MDYVEPTALEITEQVRRGPLSFVDFTGLITLWQARY